MNHHRRSVRALALLALAFSSASAWSAPTTVNGALEQIGPFRVLRVWGTPREMGFAHGFLIGGEFVADLNRHVAALPEAQRKSYDEDRSALLQTIAIPASTRAELDGLLAGIEAAGGTMSRVAGLDRAVRVEDLIWHNAGDTLRAFGCSGFTVWGPQTGRAGLITARNFDFPVPSTETLESQLVLVRQPAGKQQVATVTWPGYLGAFTGINEDGVCTFMHDGTGRQLSRPAGVYTPVALVLKDVLEEATAATAHGTAETMLKTIGSYPFSYMVRVIAPRTGDKTAKPARVFRIDADGLGENPVGSYFCITTNHYLNDQFGPLDKANDWSRGRYQVLESQMKEGMRRKVAWDALREVSSAKGAPTLHALVVYPELRELDLAFAVQKDRIFPAPKSRMNATIKFDRLFANPTSSAPRP